MPSKGKSRRAAEALPPALNLALQGGGAHGAFTWGVLDRLLQEAPFRIDGGSGTSAGAVNAVALAAGLAEGGREGARTKLAAVWEAVGKGFDRLRLRKPAGEGLMENGRLGGGGTGAPARDDSVAHLMLDVISRIYSPYDLDIFDFDPLRDLLTDLIDFKRLRKQKDVAVIVAATDIATGQARYFRNGELSVDAVLASACLPTLRKAVKIGRNYYWDGGFSSNPPLLPLVQDCKSQDTLLIKLNPTRKTAVPVKAQEIAARANHLTFSQPLRSEIETIEALRRLGRLSGLFAPADGRRVIRHRFHMIDAGGLTKDLAHTTKLTPDWELLRHLHDRGRRHAGRWLRDESAAVGKRATLDLTSLVA